MRVRPLPRSLQCQQAHRRRSILLHNLAQRQLGHRLPQARSLHLLGRPQLLLVEQPRVPCPRGLELRPGRCPRGTEVPCRPEIAGRCLTYRVSVRPGPAQDSLSAHKLADP